MSVSASGYAGGIQSNSEIKVRFESALALLPHTTPVEIKQALRDEIAKCDSLIEKGFEGIYKLTEKDSD